MRTLIGMGAVAVALAAATPAQAQHASPYVSVEAGPSRLAEIRFNYAWPVTFVGNTVELGTRTGVDAAVAGGLDFGSLRVEAELGWKRFAARRVEVGPQVFVPTAVPTANGRIRVWSAMANAVLDFGAEDSLQGFAGGGLGAARVEADVAIAGPGVPADRGINGSDRQLAWQVFAGVRMPVADRLAVGLKYRLFGTEVRLRDSNLGDASERLDGTLKAQSLLATVSYTFDSRTR